jgi:hypothetical protein
VDTTIILALDLGKFKSVACVYRRDGGSTNFRTVASTRAALAELFDAVAPAVVVIEACAQEAGHRGVGASSAGALLGHAA